MGEQSVLQKRNWANYQVITRYGTIAHDTRDTSHIRVIYKMMPNAIDRPSGLPTAQTAAVEQAYRAGVLTLSEYQAKMAENYTPSPQNSPASTLVAGVKQMTYEGAWRTMAEYPDYPAALEAVKRGTYGQYKWAKTGKPEDRRFVCNMHIDCAHMLRIRQSLRSGDAVHLVQSHTTLDHTSAVNPKRRKNSAMTWEQEALLRDRIEHGENDTNNTDHLCTHTRKYSLLPT